MEILRRRRGFTLVEMLMVIVIIGILASLLLVAFGGARRSARNAVVKMDVSQIASALENYRTENGEYPPDFVGVSSNIAAVRTPARTAVLRHLRRRFPRFVIPDLVSSAGTDQFDDFAELIYRATTDRNQNGAGACISFTSLALGVHPPVAPGDGPGLEIWTMTPSQALVFWLGGLPAYAGSNELTGFSSNPVNPFQPRSVTGSRTTRSFEFDLAGLGYDASNPAVPLAYGARDAARVLQPYLYFLPVGSPLGSTNVGDANFNWYLGALLNMPVSVTYPIAKCSTVLSAPPALSCVTPYVRTEASGAVFWENARNAQDMRPQIIWSGLDGEFGVQADNIANFTENATIGDDQ